MRKYLSLLVFILVSLVHYHQIYAQANIAPLIENAKKLADRGANDSALDIVDSALNLAKKQSDTKSIIRAMNLKGKVLFSLKKSKEGVDLYFEALKLCKSPQDNREIALLEMNIGFAYYSQGHYKEAKEYYEKELAMRKTIYPEDSLVKPLINISVMCQDLQQFDSAMMLMNEVNDILLRNESADLRGYYYLNRGALLQLAGHPDSTEYYYRKAWDSWKVSNNIAQIYKVTFNLGYLAEQKGKLKEAIDYYHLSIAAAQKFGFQREIAHVYGTMAEAYYGLKDYKNGYEYLYRYAMLNDSLSKGDFNNYVVRLDKQFQTGKNRETIQQQQLKLEQASLEAQKSKNKVLIIGILLITVLLVGVILFVYINFKSRVQKEVEAAKGRFFADVVHEIRTPLSMIQGPVKVLQSKVTDPALTYQLDIAERNTNRLNDLINQMLDISKIDAAKYKLNESIGNPTQFLSEALKSYEVLAVEKGIQLRSEIDGNLGNVLFDKDALEKVAGNLLGNAIKYTPSGGSVGMELRATIDTSNKCLLHLNVWDTGPGINKEDQNLVFERFYRTRETEGKKGIGIGLSLVRDLVNLMGGTIGLQSEPGKGSVFSVMLLLGRVNEKPNEAINLNGQQNTLLLVEDDKDILDFTKTLLIDKGYNVLTATNGIEATEVLKDHLPDLVITDVMMPGKDGIALLKEIKTNQVSSHIPVIILSARSSGEAKIQGVEEGALVYLPKPFQPDELVAIVGNQLQLLVKQRDYYRQQSESPTKPVEERFAGTDPFTRNCYQIIQEHLDDAQLSVEKLADLMNINRSHFQRKIKSLTGYSPSELIRLIRLEKARELLQNKEGNITETAYATGFTSQSYFTKCFTEHFGYPPSQEGK